MKKTRKGYTLVSANGRVMHKRIEDFKAQIMASKRSKSLKDELINELDAVVNDRRLRVKKLTETGFLGHAQNVIYNKRSGGEQTIRTMIANMGYTPGQLAKEYGFKVSDLIDPANWNGDIFTIGGIQYKLSFTYTGNVFEAIS
ncbi:MAG: hypothetical protein PUJ85_06380 [bacterium]|nr:hypothetical protein [bacterium]